GSSAPPTAGGGGRPPPRRSFPRGRTTPFAPAALHARGASHLLPPFAGEGWGGGRANDGRSEGAGKSVPRPGIRRRGSLAGGRQVLLDHRRPGALLGGLPAGALPRKARARVWLRPGQVHPAA